MTSKQRAFLRKMASSINPIASVGKGGASPEVVTSVKEALDKRELIKVTVLDNCFDEVRDIADVISERTQSQVVQVIGRKFVLYKQNREKPIIELPKK